MVHKSGSHYLILMSVNYNPERGGCQAHPLLRTPACVRSANENSGDGNCLHPIYLPVRGVSMLFSA